MKPNTASERIFISTRVRANLYSVSGLIFMLCLQVLLPAAQYQVYQIVLWFDTFFFHLVQVTGGHTGAIFDIFHLHDFRVDSATEDIQRTVDGLRPLGGLLP